MNSGYFCAYCGKEIPERVIAARKYSPETMPKRVYCSREHRTLYEQEHGVLKEMSAAGKAKRVTAVAMSNHLQPRRRRKPSK